MDNNVYFEYANTSYWARWEEGRWEIFETINGDGCGTSAMLGTASNLEEVLLFCDERQYRKV